jgi:hypothetical protein
MPYIIQRKTIKSVKYLATNPSKAASNTWIDDPNDAFIFRNHDVAAEWAEDDSVLGTAVVDYYDAIAEDITPPTKRPVAAPTQATAVAGSNVPDKTPCTAPVEEVADATDLDAAAVQTETAWQSVIATDCTTGSDLRSPPSSATVDASSQAITVSDLVSPAKQPDLMPETGFLVKKLPVEEPSLSEDAPIPTTFAEEDDDPVVTLDGVLSARTTPTEQNKHSLMWSKGGTFKQISIRLPVAWFGALAELGNGQVSVGLRVLASNYIMDRKDDSAHDQSME